MSASMVDHGSARRFRRALASLTVLIAACEPAPQRVAEDAKLVGMEIVHEPLLPLPDPPAVDARVAALGERLFHDPRLSADGTVSCASCHTIANGGDDGRGRSLGIRDQEGEINSPTVLNSGLNFVQFWDGRAATLEDQVGGPIEAPLEMGNTWQAVLKTLGADPEYTRAFQGAFADGITQQNVRAAIATFERTLLTPDSPFDRWLKGDKQALDAEQAAGYALFKGVGCIACHQGRNVGGNMFQRFGVFGDYFATRGGVKKADYGRFNVTGVESDKFVFRVPSLRNVELTAPYFHDGSAASLEDAVRTMAQYQLGRPLEDQQVLRIVAFLKSLTGRLPRTATNGLLSKSAEGAR